MSQFSLFGVAASEPSLADLDGVLLGGGRWARRADTARLSVVVADRWRADALAAEYAMRAVDGPDPVVMTTGGWSARTAFTPVLAALAQRWSRGAIEGPPPGFALTAGGLRLWAVAAGSRDEVGYVLTTGHSADGTYGRLHAVAGAQLSLRGLAAVSLNRRGEPGWRITSIRRIRRLAELLGAAPPGGEPHWPHPSG